MTILIITHQHGFEADPVIDALRARNLACIRLNQDSGSDVSEFSFYSCSDRSSIALSCDGKSVMLDAVSMGWFQQLPPFIGQPADVEEAVQRNNLIGFLEPAFSLARIPWLNRPSAVMRASRKLLQLHMAPDHGLSIPETLVSNSPEQVRRFCQEGESVVKNLNSSWISQRDGSLLSETRIVDQDILGDDEDSIRFCPLIYQRFIERRHDYRVVMLAGKRFVTRCDSGSGSRADVRVGQGTGERFYQTELPSEHLDGLEGMMGELGLDYCSADFIQGMDGKIYFLEMNTCGAWWWMDRIFDGAILDSFVKFLANNP